MVPETLKLLDVCSTIAGECGAETLLKQVHEWLSRGKGDPTPASIRIQNVSGELDVVAISCSAQTSKGFTMQTLNLAVPHWR